MEAARALKLEERQIRQRLKLRPALREAAAGQKLTMERWNRARGSAPSAATVIRLFGSWRRALAASGLSKVRSWSPQEVRNALRAFRATGHSSQAAYEEWCGEESPPVSELIRIHGSWKKALESGRPTEAECRRALADFHADNLSTLREYETWAKGRDVPYSGEIRRVLRWTFASRLSEKAALQALRRVAGPDGLTRKQYDAQRLDREPASDLIRRHFGSWRRALERAEIVSNPPGPEVCQRSLRAFLRSGSGHTAAAYESWRRSRLDRPTAREVRAALGSWREAMTSTTGLNYVKHDGWRESQMRELLKVGWSRRKVAESFGVDRKAVDALALPSRRQRRRSEKPIKSSGPGGSRSKRATTA